MAKKDRDGIYTRKGKDGFYISYIDANGRRRQERIYAATRKEALKIRAAKLARIEKMLVLGVAEAADVDFEALADRFLKYQQPRISKQSHERESGLLKNHLIPYYSGQLANIRREKVQSYVTKRLGEASPYTVQKELNTLKHMLTLAKEWELIPVNPAEDVKGPKTPPGRVRYLQPTELIELLHASPEWIRPIIILAVATGMRRGEIVGLTWSMYDSTSESFFIPLTKNNESKVVYLNKIGQVGLGLIERREDTDKLFPELSAGQVSNAFSRACKKINLKNFRFHDLRHTYSSWLRMSGTDIHTIAILLGHKDIRMSMRYSHLSPEFLHKTTGQLDRVFSALLAQPVVGIERDEGASSDDPKTATSP